MVSNSEAVISSDAPGQQQSAGGDVQVPAPVQPMAEWSQQSGVVQTNGHAAAGAAQESSLDSSSSAEGVKKKVKRNVALHVGYVGTNYTGEQHSGYITLAEMNSCCSSSGALMQLHGSGVGPAVITCVRVQI